MPLCPWYSMPPPEELGVGDTQRAIVLVGVKAEHAPAVPFQKAQIWGIWKIGLTADMAELSWG